MVPQGVAVGQKRRLVNINQVSIFRASPGLVGTTPTYPPRNRPPVFHCDSRDPAIFPLPMNRLQT